MTIDGEERIPFHSYVQCGTASARSPSQNSSIPQFSRLPVELQLRIISFCSASTLFQVMQVSSALRNEASKLFWAKTDAYFLIDAFWLMEGSHPGYNSLDLSFLPHVQNVEIDWKRSYDGEICRRHDEGIHIQQEHVINHWKSFKKRFPNAKRVLFNQDRISWVWDNETEPITQALRILVQHCPPEVEVFIFVIQEENPTVSANTSDQSTVKRQRSLYQRSVGDVWTRVGTGRHHKTVLVPMKYFHGTIGEVRRLRDEPERLLLQQYALWPLSLEALDRHHFDNGNYKPFSCPYSNCNAYFREAGEWTVHAAESHIKDLRNTGKFCILPDELKVVFEERERSLQGIREEMKEQSWKIINELVDEGIEKQRQIESEWMEQLENNKTWDTGEMAKERGLWREVFEQVVELRKDAIDSKGLESVVDS